MHCGNTLEPPRPGSNEYPESLFWIKNKSIGIPVYTPVLLSCMKVGIRTRTCFRDVIIRLVYIVVMKAYPLIQIPPVREPLINDKISLHKAVMYLSFWCGNFFM